VGCADPELLTLMVALNTTGWLTTEGFREEVRTTELDPAFTVWTSALAPLEGEELDAKLESAL
jgi:hypothetical protein